MSDHAALVKVRAHTSYMPGASRELLAGLLASIERIVEDALRAAPAPEPDNLEQLLISMRRVESANLDDIDTVYDYLRGWIRELEAQRAR